MGNSSYFRFDDDNKTKYILEHLWSWVSARCSWLQVSAFQHYRNLPLTPPLSQSLYCLPTALPPPPSVLIRLPFPLLPYDLNSPHPFPPSSRHVPSGTLQSATHSASPPSPSPTLALSLTVTLTPPLWSVVHHPDQYRPDTLGPFSRVRSPCPHLPPYPPLPNTDHPTYTGPLLV